MTELSRRDSVDQTETGSMTGLLEQVVREFAELGSDTDPLGVELVTSEILGEWWEAGDDLAAELVDYAAAAPEPERLVAPLAALRALATSAEQREAAGLALERLGAGEPAWASRLGEATVGECWQMADVYGDASSVLCVFGTGEPGDPRHGLLASINYSMFGGWAEEAAIVESPEEVVDEMRAHADASGELVTFAQSTPGRAHRLLADAFATTDRQDELEVTEDYVRFRALALARTRALPEPEPAASPQVMSAEEQAATIDEFFRDTGYPDDESIRVCVLRIIEFGLAHDPRQPLRVGPDKLVAFVDAVDEGLVELTDEQDEELEGTLLTWARWRAARAGLSEEAKELLLDAVQQRLAERDDLERITYLDGTEELDGFDESGIADVLARRRFAVPSLVTEIDGETVELDPNIPEARSLLAVGEHPELRRSLTEEDLDDQTVAAVAAYTEVVDQLWYNEPEEVWQAAQRLSDRELDRIEVLDTLAGVLAECLVPSEDEGLEFDVDDYVEALKELG